MAKDGRVAALVAKRGAMAAMTGRVLRLGIIADVQYADHDDRHNFDKSAKRMYRHALTVLDHAIADWHTQDPHAVVQLGDLVDIVNASLDPEERRAAFDLTLGKLGALKMPVTHVVGNHDLTNFPKSELAKMLKQPQPYFHFTPAPGFRALVLDGYAESVLGQDDASVVERAGKFLDEHNPNKWRESGVNFLSGLEGPAQRYVPFNGAVGATQLQWLREQLAEAHAQDEAVVVFSHLPLLPEAELDKNRYICLPWDYDQVLQVLAESDATVAAVFAGHDHAGGQGVQEAKAGRRIHHVTVPGAVESSADECHLNATFTRQPAGVVQVDLEGKGSLTPFTASLSTAAAADAAAAAAAAAAPATLAAAAPSSEE